MSRSRTALTCINTLQKLGNRNSVKLDWVPGHRGYWGNEEADNLAKQGAEAGEPSKGNIPHSYLKHSINNYINKSSREYWGKSDTPRISRMTIDDNKIKEFLKLNRLDTRIAIQILSGHAGLNHTLFKYGYTESPGCSKCGDNKENIEHFIGTCPYYAKSRGEFLKGYYMSVTDACSLNNLKQLIKFVKGTKRLEPNHV